MNDLTPNDINELRADAWKMNDTIARNKILRLVDVYEDSSDIDDKTKQVLEICEALEEQHDRLDPSDLYASDLSSTLDVVRSEMRATIKNLREAFGG